MMLQLAVWRTSHTHIFKHKPDTPRTQRPHTPTLYSRATRIPNHNNDTHGTHVADTSRTPNFYFQEISCHEQLLRCHLEFLLLIGFRLGHQPASDVQYTLQRLKVRTTVPRVPQHLTEHTEDTKVTDAVNAFNSTVTKMHDAPFENQNVDIPHESDLLPELRREEFDEADGSVAGSGPRRSWNTT